MKDYKEDYQNYYEWRGMSESNYHSGTQYHQSLEIQAAWDCQIKLMNQLEKDITQDCKTSKRSPQDFKTLQTLIDQAVGKMKERSIRSRILGTPELPKYKFDPNSKTYKDFLKEAKKILLPPPRSSLSSSESDCKTNLLLYMTEDSLAVSLPSSDKRDFIINDVNGEEAFSAEEKQILESKSSTIFGKNNNNEAKVIAKYPQNPTTLYITAYQTAEKIIVCCGSEQRRALLLQYLNLKLTEIALRNTPIIAFSIPNILFTLDNQKRRNMSKTNESMLCPVQRQYKSLYANNLYSIFPKELTQIILEYAHTCNMSIK